MTRGPIVRTRRNQPGLCVPGAATWTDAVEANAAVLDRYETVARAFNLMARQIADTEARLLDRDTRLALTIHAEQNALLRIGARKAKGASLYVWPFPPCGDCAKLIAQSGISRVVIPLNTDPALLERWQASLAIARELFGEKGISLVGIPNV